MLVSPFAKPAPAAQTAWLSGDVVLAALPLDRGRVTPLSLGGHMPSPPYGTVLVNGCAGPHRMAAFRVPVAAVPDVSPTFRLFDETAAETADGHRPDHGSGYAVALADPSSLSAAVSTDDPIELARSLDPASCRRLLEFLLGFCCTAFGLAQDRGFAEVCTRVARLCGGAEASAAVVAELLPGRLLLRGLPVAPADTVYLVGRDGIRRSDVLVDDTPPGFLVAGPAEDGDLLVALGDSVRLASVTAGRAPAPRLLALLGNTSASASAIRASCLRVLARAPQGSAEASLLRELQVLAPVQPRRHDDPALLIGGALELALPDAQGGLFLRGWLRDPLSLIATASLVTPSGVQPVSLQALHRTSRPDLAGMLAKAVHRDAQPRPGFVARLPAPAGAACLQPVLRLHLRAGAMVELTPPLRPLPPSLARDAVLSAVAPHEARGDLLADCLAPSVAALHRQACDGRGIEHVLHIGVPVPRPVVSMLVPLYRNLGFLPFQLAAFAADPACRGSDLVFALDSPEQEQEVEHLLRGLFHLHGLPMTLVVMPRNAGFAAATNAAARQARGRLLLLLNSDVVPQGPGWLDTLCDTLTRRRAAAAAAKLLFDDGSLQHAGLYFERDDEGRWFNRHYHKGMPRHWPDANRTRRVPGGTGAALLVDRARFEAVGGVCEDYVVGDYEDSDLCLRLRARGGEVVYVPQAELYHFERRSISLHPGYTRTLACQYNRHLHHQRWDASMAALMQDPAFHPDAGRSVARRRASSAVAA